MKSNLPAVLFLTLALTISPAALAKTPENVTLPDVGSLWAQVLETIAEVGDAIWSTVVEFSGTDDGNTDDEDDNQGAADPSDPSYIIPTTDPIG